MRARPWRMWCGRPSGGFKGTAIWSSTATAVNEEYAQREQVLGEGDVVALLPPVSLARA